MTMSPHVLTEEGGMEVETQSGPLTPANAHTCTKTPMCDEDARYVTLWLDPEQRKRTPHWPLSHLSENAAATYGGPDG